MHTITFVRIFAAALQLAIDRYFRLGHAVSERRPEWPVGEVSLPAQGWFSERRDCPERRHRGCGVRGGRARPPNRGAVNTRGEGRSDVLCRQRMRVFTPIPTRS